MLLKAPSNPALNNSREGASTICSLHQCYGTGGITEAITVQLMELAVLWRKTPMYLGHSTWYSVNQFLYQALMQNHCLGTSALAG